jgi:hypothetical protein
MERCQSHIFMTGRAYARTHIQACYLILRKARLHGIAQSNVSKFQTRLCGILAHEIHSLEEVTSRNEKYYTVAS